jgi:hypothetical protein
MVRQIAGTTLRGALVGAAAAVAWRIAFEIAAEAMKNSLGLDGPEEFGALLSLALLLGTPSSLLIAALIGWAVGLRRPWLVSLLWLPASALLAATVGSLLPGQRFLALYPALLPSGSIGPGHGLCCPTVNRSASCQYRSTRSPVIPQP